MAERKRKSVRGNRGRSKRGAASGGNPKRTSNGETSYSPESVESRNGASGRYSCAIMTQEELRPIIDSFAVACACSVSYPVKCHIVERARDGIYSLYIEIESSVQPKRSLPNLHSEATPTEKV